MKYGIFYSNTTDDWVYEYIFIFQEKKYDLVQKTNVALTHFIQKNIKRVKNKTVISLFVLNKTA